MASCEKCWSDAGGNPDRYAELVKQRECTAEEQAGRDAGACYVCGRKTMHQHCHVCMNSSCSSNAEHESQSEAKCALDMIRKATDHALDEAGLVESVAVLISQRDNARHYAETFRAKLKEMGHEFL